MSESEVGHVTRTRTRTEKRILLEIGQKIHRIEVALPSAYGSPRFSTLLGELIDIHQSLESGKLEAQIQREALEGLRVDFKVWAGELVSAQERLATLPYIRKRTSLRAISDGTIKEVMNLTGHVIASLDSQLKAMTSD